MKGLKVIEVLMDPRTIIAQRIKQQVLLKQPKTKTDMKWIQFDEINRISLTCSELKEDLQTILSLYKLNHSIKYKLLRYEDLKTLRFQYSEQLYSFIEFPFHHDILTWLSQTALQPIDFIPDELPSNVRKQVELVCRDVMELLGYRIIQDNHTLVNETSLLSQQSRHIMLQPLQNDFTDA